jgi:hypothetical protein
MSHAKLRAEERYGVILSDADLRGLVDQIKAKKSVCTKKLIDAEIHAVSFLGKALIAVYVPKDSMIVTFLPIDAVTSRPGRVRHARQQHEIARTYAPSPKGSMIKKQAGRYAAKVNRQNKQARQITNLMPGDE